MFKKIKGSAATELTIVLVIVAFIGATLYANSLNRQVEARAEIFEAEVITVLNASASYFAYFCQADHLASAIPTSVSISQLVSSGYLDQTPVFTFPISSMSLRRVGSGNASKSRLTVVLNTTDRKYSHVVRSMMFSASGTNDDIVMEAPLYPAGRNDFLSMYYSLRC